MSLVYFRALSIPGLLFIGMTSQVCEFHFPLSLSLSLSHTHTHAHMRTHTLLDFYLILDNFPHCPNDLAEMWKQRKMGHVTIVGPSKGDVEERLKSILKEEGSSHIYLLNVMMQVNQKASFL